MHSSKRLCAAKARQKPQRLLSLLSLRFVWFWAGLCQFRCFVLVLRYSVEDADPRLNTDAKFSAGDANALAAFCLALFGVWLSASVAVLLVSRALCWSRLLSLRFVWFCIVLGWSMAVSLL